MTDPTTIDGASQHRRPDSGAAMLPGGRWMSLVRSLLSKSRLLHRVVRSLFKPARGFDSLHQTFTSSLLLKPSQALMLAGIRSAGAGGGGPGH